MTAPTTTDDRLDQAAERRSAAKTALDLERGALNALILTAHHRGITTADITRAACRPHTKFFERRPKRAITRQGVHALIAREADARPAAPAPEFADDNELLAAILTRSTAVVKAIAAANEALYTVSALMEKARARGEQPASIAARCGLAEASAYAHLAAIERHSAITQALGNLVVWDYEIGEAPIHTTRNGIHTEIFAPIIRIWNERESVADALIPEPLARQWIAQAGSVLAAAGYTVEDGGDPFMRRRVLDAAAAEPALGPQ